MLIQELIIHSDLIPDISDQWFIVQLVIQPKHIQVPDIIHSTV